jgi:uncharacterized membrane protein
MSEFKPRNNFDRVFEISILLKAIDGVLEIIGGILILFLKTDTIISVAQKITQHELSQDPNDFIANHILHSAHLLTAGSILFASLYLLSHGIIKIVLVVEILRNHLWAYIGLIAVTVIFIIYQIYRMSYAHSVSLILLTIFDIFIVYITVKEYKKQKTLFLNKTKS